MKTVALIALCTGIAAALAGIVLQSIKIRKTGKADKWSAGTIIAAAFFIIIAVINIIFVIPSL